MPYDYIHDLYDCTQTHLHKNMSFVLVSGSSFPAKFSLGCIIQAICVQLNHLISSLRFRKWSPLGSGSLNGSDAAVRLQSAHRSNMLLIESSLNWELMGLLSNARIVIEGFSKWFSSLSDGKAGWWAYWGMESCLCEAILRFGRLEIRLKPPVLICRLLLGLLKPKDSNRASQMTSSHFWKAHRFIRGGAHRPLIATYAFL